ncbi:hypothetical protein [Paenibacillus sp. SSG-1]|uniref:hypothetical protein n=1 Tax=Paenibacillus sp. SSG-1 TaxID=1443669 RepID=UPI001C531FA7|nr:hypothetical protein [Paenibacillus sp. SSG-1]
MEPDRHQIYIGISKIRRRSNASAFNRRYDFVGKQVARENHIILVFKGYHNGQYGSYTKNPGFYKSIRFQKDDLDVYIDYDDEDESGLFKVTILNDVVGEQLKWANPTSLSKLKELLGMMKQPPAALINYINEQASLVDR